MLVSNKDMRSPDDRPEWVPMYLIGLLLAAFLLVIGAAGHEDQGPAEPVQPSPQVEPPSSGFDFGFGRSGPVAQPRLSAPGPAAGAPPDAVGSTATAHPVAPRPVLPDGSTRVLRPNRMLVAYYGTAGTGALGVLGEASPDRIMPRLRRAAAPFTQGGRTVQPVFELIVTVAHAGPTKTGTYSSDIDRARVRQYIRAAHRHRALLVLDLQPGRSDFLTVARRWAWALRDPWVGLALDPEWRMSRGGVPGQRIGSVSAGEINRVSQWLDDLTARLQLPQKVFLLHQFRTDMIRRIDAVRPRTHLASIQHVDGFGTPQEKLATFHRVVRPRQFALGFKLFYDEDVHRMSPRRVLAIRPRVSYVSFQ